MTRSLLARKPVEKESINTASTNITTAAWVQLVAATTQPASAAEIYNGSTSVLKIALGGAGSEVELPCFIAPGHSVLLPMEIAKGKRVALKALDATASAGVVFLNLFG